MEENAVKEVVNGFGNEWSQFDQSVLSSDELEVMFQNYFNIFPWGKSTQMQSVLIWVAEAGGGQKWLSRESANSI